MTWLPQTLLTTTGGFRVYTDKKDVTTSSTADTTTSITTTKTTATDEKDMPINLDIDEVYVYPQPAGENPDYVGIEEELGVKVIAKEGVDTKSYGISGAVAFPDATAKLFTIPDGMESKFAVNDFGSSGRPNMIDFAAYKNGTSTITDGSDRWIRFIEAFSNDGPQDPLSWIVSSTWYSMYRMQIPYRQSQTNMV